MGFKMINWLEYAREHVDISYEEVHQRSRRQGEFLRPVKLSGAEQRSIFTSRYVNFYELGATFYSAATMFDDFSLMRFMGSYRRSYENMQQSAYWSLGNTGNFPVVGTGHDLIASAEYERLLRVFNQRRLNAERFITANLRHAVELCLKVLIAIANNKRYGQYVFPWGHDLRAIYSELPAEFRKEIEDQVAIFASAYLQHVEKMEALRHQLFIVPAHSGTLIDAWEQTKVIMDQIITDLNAGDYTSFSSGNPRWNPAGGSDQLIRALEQGPQFGGEHRYGPNEGPDEYPTEWVANARILGQFFYEHLFPATIIDPHEDGLGPLQKMRGPRI